MFRSFAVTLDTNGNGNIDLSPYIESVEWDIYQISVQTGQVVHGCTCQIQHNRFFLCGSAQGSLDCAIGPPDIVVMPSDLLTIMWSDGKPGDQAMAGVWYNENPTGTTYSSSH